MSNEPKTRRERLVETYHQLNQHLDNVALSPSVREQLKQAKADALAEIKAIDAGEVK